VTANRDGRALQIGRWALLALVGIVVAVALWTVRDVLMLGLTGIIIALIVTTPVRWLVRLGLARTLAVVCSLLLMLVLLLLIAALVLPGLLDQFRQLIAVLQKAVNPSTYSLSIPILDAQNLGLLLQRIEQPSAALQVGSGILSNLNLSSVANQLSAQFTSSLSSIPSQLFPFVGSLASGLLSVLITLFMGLYLVSDPDTYTRGAIRLFPISYRARAKEIIGKLEGALRHFLQAQILLMLLTGVSTAIMIALLGLPLAGALGTLTGLFSFVPNFGPIVSLLPILAVVLLNDPARLVETIAVYYALQLLLNQLLAPLLVGQEINIPPVVILLAQIIAGVFFGFLGLMLSIPLAVIVSVIVREVYIRDILGDTDGVLNIQRPPASPPVESISPAALPASAGHSQ